MIHGLAAAVFLGMAILFIGVAVITGSLSAWVIVLLNALLFVLNLKLYGQQVERRNRR